MLVSLPTYLSYIYHGVNTSLFDVFYGRLPSSENPMFFPCGIPSDLRLPGTDRYLDLGLAESPMALWWWNAGRAVKQLRDELKM
jgi:hypothetical protein